MGGEDLMACGCQAACGCNVTAGAGVTVQRIGDNFIVSSSGGIPWIVSETQPANPAPYFWAQTDGGGLITNIWYEDGT